MGSLEGASNNSGVVDNGSSFGGYILGTFRDKAKITCNPSRTKVEEMPFLYLESQAKR